MEITRIARATEVVVDVIPLVGALAYVSQVAIGVQIADQPEPSLAHRSGVVPRSVNSKACSNPKER